jgi:hypothetical protein
VTPGSSAAMSLGEMFLYIQNTSSGTGAKIYYGLQVTHIWVMRRS